MNKSFGNLKRLFKSPDNHQTIRRAIDEEFPKQDVEGETCAKHGTKLSSSKKCKVCVDEMYEPTRKLIDCVVDDMETSLEHVASTNEVHIQQKENFDGEKIPQINLNDYLYRLVRYMDEWFKVNPTASSVGIRTLVMSVIYIDRIRKMVDGFSLNDYNVHRLFMVSMLLAAKFSEDKPVSNAFWAKVGGVKLDKLNHIESTFCTLTSFNLSVSDEEYDRVYADYNAR